MTLHDSHVDRIAGRQPPVAEEPPGSLDIGEVDWQHRVGDPEQDLERRLDGLAPVDRHVAVEYLLEDLRIGDEPLLLDDDPLQELSRSCLVGVIGSDEIHRDVGVDEDHGGVGPA